MSVELRFSSHIHDTFLHISPNLYFKIYNQIAPLIQLNFNDNLIFWCIKDPSIQGNFIQINSKIAERLGLEIKDKYTISIGPFKYIPLSKVMVSLPNGSEDWQALHEDYENLQSHILNQVRLVKRGNQFPIYSSSRKAPIWIKVEEFGGYQSPETLGIISDDTELIFIDSQSESNQTRDDDAQSFTAVPSSGFEFACNPAHNIPEICRFQNHQFRIHKIESVPPEVLIVPSIILTDVFRISPKSKITLLSGISIPQEFSGILNYSTNDSLCKFDNDKHLDETIIPTLNGIAVKSNDFESHQIFRVKTPVVHKPNTFSDFIAQTVHRLILFHGQPGCGKSKAVSEAIHHLNFSCSYSFKIIYLDLNISKFSVDSFIEEYSVIILDHVDEYLQAEHDDEDEITRKYTKLCRYITDCLKVHKSAKFVLISRSCKIFSRFTPNNVLRFDHSFTLEKSHGWNFDINPEPLKDIYGFEKEISILHRLILNPLKFCNVFASNNMDLHTSILLSGPSGSGKTFLALKFLEHYKVPFIHIHGPEILDKYVGSSERGVRDIFARARNLKPCVVLFDEFDSLVPKRGSNQSGVTDRIVNQFLTELDGTEDRSGVFIIATTSRPDLIDKAILRPGRIDQRIELSYPKIDEIKSFLAQFELSFKKIKAFIRVLASNQSFSLSWADLKSINREDPLSSLSLLMNSCLIMEESQKSKLEVSSFSQKLTLA